MMRTTVVAAMLAVSAAPAWGQQTAVATTERRGWFGISLSCDECFIQRGPNRVAYTRAPAIYTVESGSPAHNAGLRNGDTIIAVDGMAITTPEGFERFAAARAGVPIRLTVRKQGQERIVEVVPAERSSASTIRDFYEERLRIARRSGLNALRNSFRSPLGWLGMGLECEDCSVTETGVRRSWRFRRLPMVLTVDVDGPAHRAGLRRGDTLTAIDGIDLTTSEGGRAFAQVEPGQRVTLTMRRAGRDTRIPLVAVARPDATREEVAAYEEYRRTRDSIETEYRAVATASVAQASAQMRELEALLRAGDLNRAAIDSSRRRLQVIDSVLRALRRDERQQLLEGLGGDGPRAIAMPAIGMPGIAPTAAVAPMPPGARPILSPRYSGRLGNVTIEARALGAVNVQEVGDSVVILLAPGVEVRIAMRGPVRR